MSDRRLDLPPVESIKVLVVAAVRLYREGMAANIHRRDGLSVVGTASNFRDAVAIAATESPHIVLIDMATGRGLELVRVLRRDVPAAKVVAVAVEELDSEIIACAEAGVAGYVPCDASMDDLVAAIKSLTQGELRCSPRIAATLFRRVTDLASGVREPHMPTTLTSREREVLSLIDRGLSNKEIAVGLHIEVNTVKNHVHHLLEKLRVGSRAEAAARYQFAGRRTQLAGNHGG